jgi:hypothetical protein
VQTKYLQMMQHTQQAIERANEISATAERVTNMLGVHRDDLQRMGETVAATFQAIRTQLQTEETAILLQIETLKGELDQAVTALKGEPPAAPVETPTEQGETYVEE